MLFLCFLRCFRFWPSKIMISNFDPSFVALASQERKLRAPVQRCKKYSARGTSPIRAAAWSQDAIKAIKGTWNSWNLGTHVSHLRKNPEAFIYDTIARSCYMRQRVSTNHQTQQPQSTVEWVDLGLLRTVFLNCCFHLQMVKQKKQSKAMQTWGRLHTKSPVVRTSTLPLQGYSQWRMPQHRVKVKPVKLIISY